MFSFQFGRKQSSSSTARDEKDQVESDFEERTDGRRSTSDEKMRKI